MVEFWSENSLSDKSSSRVVISIERCGCHSNHLGLLCFSQDTQKMKKLHILLGDGLIFEDAKDGEPFVEVTKLEGQALAHDQLSAWCRAVYRANEKSIPFGFDVPFCSIDRETGKYIPGLGGGLTCAGLVLAVFTSAGYPLISENASWDDSSDRKSEDQMAFDRLIAAIGRKDPVHARALREALHSTRYRPEEVAAAAMVAPPAVKSFEEVRENAQSIQDALIQHAKREEERNGKKRKESDAQVDAECRRLGHVNPTFEDIMRRLDNELGD